MFTQFAHFIFDNFLLYECNIFERYLSFQTHLMSKIIMSWLIKHSNEYMVLCFHNPNTIKSYNLSPKHAAHGVAQSTYLIYRYGKACLSKQPPPPACSWGPSPSTRQVPGSSPGPRGRAARTFSLHPPFLPPSGDSFLFAPSPPTPQKC